MHNYRDKEQGTRPEPSQVRRTISSLLKMFGLLREADNTRFLVSLLAAVMAKLLFAAAAFVAKLIIDELAVQKGLSSLLWVYLGIEFGLLFVSALLQQLENLSSDVLGLKLQQLLQLRIAKHTSSLDIDFFDHPQNYDALERARGDLGVWPLIATMNVFQALEGLAAITGFVVLILAFQPVLLIMLIAAVVPTVFVARLSGAGAFELSHLLTPDARKSGYFEGLLTDVRFAKDVRLYGLATRFYQQMKHFSERTLAKRTAFALRTRKNFALAEAAAVAVRYAAIGFALFKAASGDISLGDFTLLVTAVASVQIGLTQTMASFSEILEGSLRFFDATQFLGERPRTVSHTAPLPARTGSIKLENVSFAYPDSQEPVIDGLSVSIKVGEVTAIVGANGAGKSTLVKLITRLYEPQHGRITIDGLDICQLAAEDYRTLFSVVMQDFARYHVSLGEYVASGDVDAPISVIRLNAAAEYARMSELVDALPLGWETPLGKLFDQRGQDLSGGQWQRVALARAHYRDAPIFILDEPTAALDPETEAELFDMYRIMTKGKTSILISHRLNTTMTADKILVIEGGRLIEEGSHEELMAQRGRYHALFTAQAKNYLRAAT